MPLHLSGTDSECSHLSILEQPFETVGVDISLGDVITLFPQTVSVSGNTSHMQSTYVKAIVGFLPGLQGHPLVFLLHGSIAHNNNAFVNQCHTLVNNHKI